MTNENTNQENTNQENPSNEIEEGKLYRVQNGELIELILDPDELRKIKVTEDAVTEAINLQKLMRPLLNGFKPDLTTVCSALIKHAATKDDATKVVADFWFEKAQTARDAINKST